MDVKIFADKLKSALVSRGIGEELASMHVDTMMRSFGESDIAEINAMDSDSEIERIAEDIASAFKIKKPLSKAKPAKAETDNEATHEVDLFAEYAPNELSPDNFEDEADKEPEPMKKTKEKKEPYKWVQGDYIFLGALILTAPVTLFLAASVLCVFAALFLALFALIVAALALTIGIATLCAAVSLVSIVYGVTQLFTFVAAGLFEIGLGVTAAGIGIAASILVYNFGVRFLPWLCKLLGRFFMFLCGQLKRLLTFIREECRKI